MHQYVCLGRRTPTETEPNPIVYQMTIFAKNEMIAESRFWHSMNQQHKIKRAAGQFISVTEVHEDDTDVHTYGILLHYRCATGQHSMYREIRETTAARAVNKMYQEMAGHYHVQYKDIKILDVQKVANEDARRVKTQQVLPVDEKEIERRKQIREKMNERLAALSQKQNLSKDEARELEDLKRRTKQRLSTEVHEVQFPHPHPYSTASRQARTERFQKHLPVVAM